MMIKEDKQEHKQAISAINLEATQLVSPDDLKELEQLRLVRAAVAEPVKPRGRVIAAGIVSGLVLAAGLLAAVLRNGGHF